MAQDQSGTPIQDRRPKPPGVLPRHLQMWLMVGIALAIFVIILVTGRTSPPPRAATPDRPVESPAALSERIRSYRQQLAEDQAHQQQLLAQQQSASTEAVRTANPDAVSRDPLADERRRREYQSLFADSVALSRRASAQQPYAEHARRAVVELGTLPGLAPATASAATPGTQTPNTTVATAPTLAAAPESRSAVAQEPGRVENPASGPRSRLLEGTVIEAVLTNRIDGSLAGPVNGLVTNAVYSPDRQALLIPAGARVLGDAAPIQNWGESRLAVTFHRLVMPDGHAYSLDRFKGLDQIGETGLRDEVNRHYLQVFGASLAIGAISGLAQYNTRTGFDYTFSDAYRQAAGASLANSTARVLDRYLNVLPTITIREGFRMKVYLTNDLELPVYAAVDQGGNR
jgi:type IV secretion system protein VirB10